MTKDTIIQKLQIDHYEFIDLMLSLSESDFTLSVNNKWTAGQHFEHICLSVSPLTKALRLPRFVLKMIFGKANRPSRDYDPLVEKYHDKLAKGGTASRRFIPKQVNPEQQILLKNKLSGIVEQLCKTVNRYSELELDHYILPHPLLGKITIREMLYFTIYHVEHHKKLLLQTINIPK